MRLMEEFIEFLMLLRDPANHVRTPSAVYVEKPVNPRQVADMTNEMAQEIGRLPRYTAYVKVIAERGGQQLVESHKMQTIAPPEVAQGYLIEQNAQMEHAIISRTQDLYCKEREAVEEELRKRQEKWRAATGQRLLPVYTRGKSKRRDYPGPGLIGSQDPPPTSEEPPLS